MNRLLLIAHVFPPAPSPGALRPGYLSRYLSQFGWDVTVLTDTAGAPPFPANVVSTAVDESRSLDARIRAKVGKSSPDSGLRRFLRAVKENVLFPDSQAPWIPRALAAGRELLRTQHFDAILSTAHPASAHVVAWILAKESGLPWIADYRDPWAGNAYIKRPLLRALLEEFLERGMIRRASAVTTISQPIADQLRRFHRRREVFVVPNAYDTADWSAIPEAQPERFDLVFTGSMYGGKRSPDIMFEALSRLRAAGEPAGVDARVHFYGRNSENVGASAAAHGVSLIVRQHGMVPRAHAMRAQRNSAALLVFLNMDPATASEMGSKYLEYLGAHRHILAFGPRNSVMRTFIEERGLGWFASDADEAVVALRAAYEKYRAGAYHLDVESSDVPTARTLAFRFANILDRTAGAQLDRAV